MSPNLSYQKIAIQQAAARNAILSQVTNTPLSENLKFSTTLERKYSTPVANQYLAIFYLFKNAYILTDKLKMAFILRTVVENIYDLISKINLLEHNQFDPIMIFLMKIICLFYSKNIRITIQIKFAYQ